MLQSEAKGEREGGIRRGGRESSYVCTLSYSIREKWNIIFCKKNLNCNMSSEMPVDQ
jgi:hypothetical protein